MSKRLKWLKNLCLRAKAEGIEMVEMAEMVEMVKSFNHFNHLETVANG